VLAGTRRYSRDWSPPQLACLLPEGRWRAGPAAASEFEYPPSGCLSGRCNCGISQLICLGLPVVAHLGAVPGSRNSQRQIAFSARCLATARGFREVCAGRVLHPVQRHQQTGPRRALQFILAEWAPTEALAPGSLITTSLSCVSTDELQPAGSADRYYSSAHTVRKTMLHPRPPC